MIPNQNYKHKVPWIPSPVSPFTRNCSTSDNSTQAPPSGDDWHLDVSAPPISGGSGICSRCPWIQQGELQSGCLQLRAAVWLDGGIRTFPADGLTANHLGSSWTIVISSATKLKSITPGYFIDAHQQLKESVVPFSLYWWCASALACFRTTAAGSYISSLTTDKLCFVGPNAGGEMDNEKYLPELMAEKDSLDPSFQHSMRLLDQGKSRCLLSNSPGRTA